MRNHHMKFLFRCAIIYIKDDFAPAGKEQEMYHIGDFVVYGIHGVCRILALEERIVDRKSVQYYVLEPLEQSGARFLIPTRNQAAVAKLKQMLTREELENLLRSQEVHADAWIADENQRKQTYRALINSGDRAALLRMVGTLHRHKTAQQSAGKKFHLCDDNFLRDAQKLLSSEFSQILGIAPEQVGSYVLSAMNME